MINAESGYVTGQLDQLPSISGAFLDSVTGFIQATNPAVAVHYGAYGSETIINRGEPVASILTLPLVSLKAPGQQPAEWLRFVARSDGAQEAYKMDVQGLYYRVDTDPAFVDHVGPTPLAASSPLGRRFEVAGSHNWREEGRNTTSAAGLRQRGPISRLGKKVLSAFFGFGQAA